MIPTQSSSQLQKGHFWPIRACLRAFASLVFWENFTSLSWFSSHLHIFSHFAVWPRPHLLHIFTTKWTSQVPNNAMTKKIWELSCGDLCQPDGSLCKCPCVNFSRVSWEWLGMARVPPPPSSAYWPPHSSHVRFFSDNTSQPVLVGQQPPPSLLSHRLSQEAAAAAAGLPHTQTHTHMGHSLRNLALIRPPVPYSLLSMLCLARKILSFFENFPYGGLQG